MISSPIKASSTVIPSVLKVPVLSEFLNENTPTSVEAVSYTHLDVYKRQGNKGGKCELTENGESLTARYRKMEQRVNEQTQLAFKEYFPEYTEKGR